jgi:murein DD-endopeptidase MepM/ murein hydrolase activator NlpD
MDLGKPAMNQPASRASTLLLYFLMLIDGCSLAYGEPVKNPVLNKPVFPIKGIKTSFTGITKHTAPDSPGMYVVAKPEDWYYQWPVPKPGFGYHAHHGKARVDNNQEPGYYACRPSAKLPHGCGRPHQGVDIYAHYGTPIVAPENGIVVAYGGEDVFAAPGKESKNGGSGRLIKLAGASGYAYVFMHTMGLSEEVANLARIKKDFGEAQETRIRVPVKAGDIIGYVGSTGGIVNPHLHFQVMRGGKSVDPSGLWGEE